MSFQQHLPTYIQDFRHHNWKIFQSPHFLHYVFETSVAEREIESIIEVQEKAYEKISSFLKEAFDQKGIAIDARPIELFYYPTGAEKKCLMGDDYWGQAIYNEYLIHSIYNETDRVVGQHEITHLMSLPFGLSIGFFQEGLAEFLTGHDWFGNPHKNNVIKYGLQKYPALAEFMRHEFWVELPEEVMPPMYSYAGLYTHFLIEKFGKRAYMEVYESLSRKNNAIQNRIVCESKFNITLESVHQFFLGWVSDKKEIL